MEEEIPLTGVEGRKSSKPRREGRKKRSKKKIRKEEETDNLNNSSASNVGAKSDVDNEDRIKNDISDIKSKKKDVNMIKEERRKRRERREAREAKEEQVEEDIPREERELQIQASKEVIGVFVHECELLKMDFFISHPVVKVSLVDGRTGKLLQKTDPHRRVTSYYEDEKVFGILPIMTQPFDFRLRKSVIPKWEELLLFNDDFTKVFEQNQNVVMFFEILDFVSMAAASENYRRYKEKGGWYKIAWAFLKIRENEWRTKRFGERVRLQLYKPPVSATDGEGDISDIWKCWKSDKRKYPCTLWVTVESILPPTSSEPTLRSMVPTQPELGFQTSSIAAEVNSPKEDQHKISWSRFPGQSCKVPNSCLLELSSGPRGCSALAFSLDGRLMAAGIANQTTSFIRIYDVPSGILVTELSEVYGLIYQISFHQDGLMVAAVGDGVVPVWDTSSWKIIDKLSHPSYIYSAVFYPKNSSIIGTAGFDRVIRLWAKGLDRTQEDSFAVIQELSGHNSLINCILFEPDGHFLFSGDKTGLIKLWEQTQLGFESSTDSFAPLNKHRNWVFKREYNVADPVCRLSLHPGGRRLLLHRINPTAPLVMLDLRNGSFMQTYPDIQTFRVPAASCITPCGSWVIGGSNSGYAVVWNTDTGIKQHVYTDLPYESPVSAVEFHPMDHYMVVSSSQPNSKILFFSYDKDLDTPRNEDHQVLSTPRDETQKSRYPFKQVARMISDGYVSGEDKRPPVDLQDIVEKLNNALRECKQKKNFSLEDEFMDDKHQNEENEN